MKIVFVIQDLYIDKFEVNPLKQKLLYSVQIEKNTL